MPNEPIIERSERVLSILGGILSGHEWSPVNRRGTLSGQFLYPRTTPAYMARGASPTVHVQSLVDLQPGQEWSSDAFDLTPGHNLSVHAVGTTRFYLRVVDTALWDQLRGPQAIRPFRPWPFTPGADATTFDFVVPIYIGGPYRVVIRVGVFSHAGRVRVRIAQD